MNEQVMFAMGHPYLDMEDYNDNFETLLLAYEATAAHIKKLIANPVWTDRWEKKQFEARIWSLQRFIVEMGLIWLSKSIEEILREIKRVKGVKFDIWDIKNNRFPHIQDARRIRALGNVIKHNRSTIETRSRTSEEAFLIKECGFKETLTIDVHYMAEMQNFEQDMLSTYQFIQELTWKIVGLPKGFRRRHFRNYKSLRDFLFMDILSPAQVLYLLKQRKHPKIKLKRK